MGACSSAKSKKPADHDSTAQSTPQPCVEKEGPIEFRLRIAYEKRQQKAMSTETEGSPTVFTLQVPSSETKVRDFKEM